MNAFSKPIFEVRVVHNFKAPHLKAYQGITAPTDLTSFFEFKRLFIT